MSVGQAQPVARQVFGVLEQLWPSFQAQQFEYFSLGMRALQWQLLFVQQAAEKGPVEQAKRFAWVLVPEPLYLGDNVRRNAFGLQVKPEQYGRHRLALSDPQLARCHI